MNNNQKIQKVLELLNELELEAEAYYVDDTMTINIMIDLDEEQNY